MFLEYDLLDRFQAARDAGFGAVEVQFPYDVPVADLKSAKDDADVEITVINVGVGDLVEGGPGLAAVPGREDEFKQAVDVACEYAEVLNPLNMNILAGWPSMDEFAREECLGVLVGNARYAAGALQECGVTALVEAVNTRDRAGYLIHTTDQALELLPTSPFILGTPSHFSIHPGKLPPTSPRILGAPTIFASGAPRRKAPWVQIDVPVGVAAGRLASPCSGSQAQPLVAAGCANVPVGRAQCRRPKRRAGAAAGARQGAGPRVGCATLCIAACGVGLGRVVAVGRGGSAGRALVFREVACLLANGWCLPPVQKIAKMP